MTEAQGYIEYDSNNSGGYWWLSDDDWYALEKAGWVIDWYADQVDMFPAGMPTGGRFLGALAGGAKRYGLSLEAAIHEWKQVTGKDPFAVGCHCCGRPHSFWEYDSSGRMV